jgi:hypothetical protein
MQYHDSLDFLEFIAHPFGDQREMIHHMEVMA